MVDRPHACGSEIDLARVGPGIGDQFGDRVGGERRMHRQYAGCVADQADRREALARVVAGILVERRTDRQRAGIAEQDRVAIGLALGDRLGADRTASARTVVDHDALAQQLAHLVGDHPANDRRGAARRERNHQCDGPARKVLRPRLPGAGQAEQNRRGAEPDLADTHVRKAYRRLLFLLGHMVDESAAAGNPSFGWTIQPREIARRGFSGAARNDGAYFQANTGCSSSTTRVARPSSTSRN